MKEIERKWLFNMDKVPDYMSLTRTAYSQAYLVATDSIEVRIRKKQVNFIGSKAACPESWALTVKSGGDLTRVEVQKELSQAEFEELKSINNLTDKDFINKERLVINVNGYYLAVGLVDMGTKHEFCYGEIEFPTEKEANEFVVPEWFGKEVTYDTSYKMKNYWNRTRGE